VTCQNVKSSHNSALFSSQQDDSIETKNTKCGALLKLLGLPQYYEEKEQEKEETEKEEEKQKVEKQKERRRRRRRRRRREVELVSRFFFFKEIEKEKKKHSVICNSELDHPDSDQIWPYYYISNINTLIKSGHIVILATSTL